MVAKELQSVNWATVAIDLVPRAVHEHPVVGVDAEEPLYAISDRLLTIAKVVVVRVAMVGRPAVWITTGGRMLVGGHRVRVTTVTGGRSTLKI